MLLPDFLAAPGAKRIYYRLDRVRDATMVEVFVPGEHWEVFTDDGTIEIERFGSDGVIGDQDWLPELFRRGPSTIPGSRQAGRSSRRHHPRHCRVQSDVASGAQRRRKA